VIDNDDDVLASRILARVATFATAEELTQDEQDARFLRAVDEINAEVRAEMDRLLASIGPGRLN
jgi:hypothetical protein